MAFQKMVKPKYPPRLWSLVGYPGSGKSTFAVQMAAPVLSIDADHRFGEVIDLAPGDVFALSSNPADQVDPDRIAALLGANMPGSGVKTIVVDSLTAIISPLVVQAMVNKEQGREKNLMAGFKDKALAMRQLQDAVTRWGVDVLWIYHLNDARDANAKEVVKATVSSTEVARLTRSINMQLEIVQNGHRGIKIVWARRGRAFPQAPILWDETGCWRGMPERIEAAAYDGLSKEQQDEIEKSAPTTFPNPETAVAWAVERGAFGDPSASDGSGALQHARNAYDKLKRDKRPDSAAEMRDLWVADVLRRLKE